MIMRWSLRLIISVLILTASLIAYGYYETTSDPIARQATIMVDDWPQDTSPLRVLLLADTQLAGPDMTPERLSRIVDQINAKQADLILLAGDYISEKRLATQLYTADEVITPLGELKARLGVYAVLGNHDYWADEQGIVSALQTYDITVLRNTAIQVGPINLIGVDDEFTGHDDVAKAKKALAKLPQRPNILLSHSPDIVPELPFDTDIVLAGHTHCAQIILPLAGAVSYVSRYGGRFNCGVIDDEGRKIIVSAGLGTSVVPLRIGAPPDYWIITLKGTTP